MTLAPIEPALKEAGTFMEDVLGELLPEPVGPPARVVEAMRYATLDGGKRIRAFLVLQAGRQFGVDRRALSRVAAALECVHAYSLVHDDLPAMDDDDLRRGKPTTHKKFDEATAILAGDALLTHAFALLAANSVYDCAGFYANQCDVPNPEWRHRGRVTWLTPWDIDVSGTWRYYGESEVAVLGPDGSLNNSPARIDKVLDDKNYFDLAAVWQARDTVTLRAGVNNVFDSVPPLSVAAGTGGNENTYPQLYDALGRYMFVGISANF